MASITNWLAEAHQQGMAQMVVEDTLYNLKQRSKLLDGYVPFKTFESRQFLAYVLERMDTIASVIPYGMEPPTTQMGTFRKINAELMKSGLSYEYDENKQWEMREAMKEAKYKNIMVQTTRDPATGQIIRGSNDDLAKYIFGTIEQIARAQVELLDTLTWEILQTGKVERVDPRTQLKTILDYRNPHDTSYNHFPSAKAGNDRWDQYATANGIQDLYNAVQDYVDTNGFAPEKIVMARRLLNDLMQQQSTKDSASSMVVTQVGTVSPEMLSAVLKARQIPDIVTFDEMYRNELSDKSTAKVRFLRDNTYVFLAPEMGYRAMGPTLENDGAPGVYVVTREISPVPPVDATQGVATILPVFTDPKLLYAQQVKTEA